MARSRRSWQIRVDEEARDAIQRAADHHGVTVTALLEAIGDGLRSGTFSIPAKVVSAARAIDVARRSRR